MSALSLLPVEGLPEIGRGDDLAELIASRFRLQADDVLVVAQKIVSKAEGRIRRLAGITPGDRAVGLARRLEADPRFVQAILDESARIVRSERVLIVETRQGYVCANAGIDHSNVTGDEGEVLLLPKTATVPQPRCGRGWSRAERLRWGSSSPTPSDGRGGPGSSTWRWVSRAWRR